jgi:hypothetical protein
VKNRTGTTPEGVLLLSRQLGFVALLHLFADGRGVFIALTVTGSSVPRMINYNNFVANSCQRQHRYYIECAVAERRNRLPYFCLAAYCA